MVRLRTIPKAVQEIKMADPNSALTEWGLRQLVSMGEIACVKVGNRRLVTMEEVEEYIGNGTKGEGEKGKTF